LSTNLTKNPKQKNLITSATLTSEQRREVEAVAVLELKDAGIERWRRTAERGDDGGGESSVGINESAHGNCTGNTRILGGRESTQTG
jgi:hypothetical protein